MSKRRDLRLAKSALEKADALEIRLREVKSNHEHGRFHQPDEWWKELDMELFRYQLARIPTYGDG